MTTNPIPTKDPLQTIRALNLNPREERFLFEFLVDGNAAAAARRSGYSARSSNTTGYQLIKRHENILNQIRDVLTARHILSAEEVLQETSAIAASNIADVLRQGAKGQLTIEDFARLPKHVTAAIKEVEFLPPTRSKPGYVKLKMHGKDAAQRLMAQHHGLIGDMPPTPDAGADPRRIEVRNMLVLMLNQQAEVAAGAPPPLTIEAKAKPLPEGQTSDGATS